VVSGLREDGRARRAGDGPCQRVLQSGFHTTGAHYINGDTTAFMQLMTSDLFKDFPTMKFIIPHGGGAVPYHWGRYRGLAQDMKRPPLRAAAQQRVLRHLRLSPARHRAAGQGDPGRQHPVRLGDGRRGRGIDPETGHHYDDTKRYACAAAHWRWQLG
jgi:4-oxalmesaconate hydratase